MSLSALESSEHLVYRCSGPEDAIPLLYLPGVHGCWTPFHRASRVLASTYRLVEVAYPLIERWTLDSYADELEQLLDKLGLPAVHLLGESFGSLIAWQFGLSHRQSLHSHILIGGFSSPPPMRIAASAGLGLDLIGARVFDTIVDAYVAVRYAGDERHGHDRREEASKLYPGVRGARGQRATANRMRLIQSSDFRSSLPEVGFPVRYLGGARDRVIPIRREIALLQRRLPDRSNFASRLIVGAPHMVLASHPEACAEQIGRWVRAIETGLEPGD